MADITAGQLLAAGALNSLIVDLLSGEGTMDTVTTAETTTSTSYTDLSTVGPQVTVTSEGTKALVLFGCKAFTVSDSQIGHSMSFAVSGDTTIAVSDVYARQSTHNNAGFGFSCMSFALVTINPGTNVFTAKYKVSAATSSQFSNRQLLVIAP